MEESAGAGAGVTMKWFGVAWGAPICEDAPHVPPPIGEFCSHCGEAIFASDSGVIASNGPPFHRNCFFRITFGSVAHFEKRCGCYVKGATEGDPPGMTKREAANAAAKVWGLTLDDAEEVICDFCSAREPLVRDVQARDQIVAGYKSGANVVDSGVWGACAECATLIDAKDWQGLMERAVVGSLAIDPDLSPEGEREYRARLRLMLDAVFGVKV